MLSLTYLLIAASKIYVPFTLELHHVLPSRVLKGCMVAIGLENSGGAISEFSSSLTLSFKMEFSFSM
jgi:hypothetical protein